MGQKVNPISFRLCNGNSRMWSSNWFCKDKKEYEIEKQLKKQLNNQKVSFDVKELKHSNLNANLIARLIADKIENRQSFKRAAKSAMEQVMKAGAVGVKISCAGRLNGAEIARTEKFKQGVIPLHTLRADVDYACQEALTTYGIIGIKVWICTKR